MSSHDQAGHVTGEKIKDGSGDLVASVAVKSSYDYLCIYTLYSA